MRSARARFGAVILLSLAAAGRAAAQQDLGHKVLGTLGLNAGVQPDPGLYADLRLVLYNANGLVDRHGNRIPLGIDLDAWAAAIGLSGSYRVTPLRTYFSACLAAPIARVTANTDRVEASIDRFGLGDFYVQPLRLGWRASRADLVTGYAFYVPTGRFEPGGMSGVSRGGWSHELSLGGTIYVDRARTWKVSALASYELNERKIGIDITRGDTVQIQGGAGAHILRVVDAGVVGYALRQVRDDRGSALPPVLQGARDQVTGLGVEADVLVPSWRSRLTFRYTVDLAEAARPAGQVAVVGLTIVVFRPRRGTSSPGSS